MNRIKQFQIKQFLELIREQPDDNWRTAWSCDSNGRKCPLGWALYRVGVPEETLRRFEGGVAWPREGPTLNDLAGRYFGLTPVDVASIIAINDQQSDDNHQLALKLISRLFEGSTGISGY